MRPHTIIVGGTRGSGRTYARMLAARGEAVTVIGRRTITGTELGHAGITTISADITDTDRHAELLGHIAAANGPWSSIAFFQKFRGQGDTWEGEWRVSIDATRRLIELLAAQSPRPVLGRSIVIVGSVAGEFVITDQPVSYHAAKAALEHMVRVYAVRLGPQGIRVNMASPHMVLKEESAAFYQSRPDLLSLFQQIIPLGRMGTSDEVANVVDFLCSEKAAYVTGQNIVVDGGMTLSAMDGVARRLLNLAP